MAQEPVVEAADCLEQRPRNRTVAREHVGVGEAVPVLTHALEHLLPPSPQRAAEGVEAPVQARWEVADDQRRDGCRRMRTDVRLDEPAVGLDVIVEEDDQLASRNGGAAIAGGSRARRRLADDGTR